MNNKNDFTQGPILKKLIIFMLPILASLILQAAYSAVDSFVIGNFGTTNVGLSGVSTGSTVISFVTFSIAGFSTGITVLIGRYMGEKNYQKIGKVIGGAVVIFIILSIIITVVLVLFAEYFARLLKAPEEALGVTVQYIRVCGAGTISIVFYNVISCIYRGLGNSKYPLFFVAISCVINIALDLLFVIVLKWEVIGVALATVIAQTISVISSIIVIKFIPQLFKLKLSDFRISQEVKKFSLLGLPMAIQEIITNGSFVALCSFVNILGLESSSGYAVANRITSFILLIPSSIMQSMASFVAQNVGANKEKRARKAMLTGMIFGGSIGLFVAIFIFFFGEFPSMIFSTDPIYIQKSAEYLKGFALESVVTCVLFSFIGYFSGHGKTIFVMIQGIVQTLLVRLPVAYLMSNLENTNLTLIALSAPLATITGIIINVVYFWISNKNKKIITDID